MKKPSESAWSLSPAFEDALVFASASHRGQMRKGTSIPYISHPLGVASIALEFGASETQAIAALLHDTIEDCEVSRAEIERRFGADAARIVADCTDSSTTPKPPWKERKARYIAHLAAVRPDVLLVSAADKLHNSGAIVRDVGRDGPGVWKRFSQGPDEVVWYYRSLLAAFQSRSAEAGPGLGALLLELEKTVAAMTKLSKLVNG
jgi:GTP pyrophosphokinase